MLLLPGKWGRLTIVFDSLLVGAYLAWEGSVLLGAPGGSSFVCLSAALSSVTKCVRSCLKHSANW